ncbi:MAG: FAD-dependent monooxygenase [Alphaproteobacteria bacterium]|nr:FAD-dependent monooxygenase [Alphaproteobacteria bacterium]
MSDLLSTEVLISGGGFAGLALALALDRAGIAALVVDAAPLAETTLPAFDGRVFAIAPDVVRMLTALGVWQRVRESQPVREIVVSGGAVGAPRSPFFLHFDEADAGGAPLFEIAENRFLRMALLEAASGAPHMTLVSPARIETAETGAAGVTGTLAGGRPFAARLLVAAEGRQSPLRDRFGIRTSGWSYGQTAIVCTVEHERPHGGTAQDYFLPGGPFGILPMTGNRSSLVWAEPTARAAAILALPDADFAAETARRFTDFLGAVRPVGPRWSYPLATHLARDYVATRFALLGDAAHGVHPLAGQGLNLALRDVAVLAELVTDAVRIGLDPGAGQVLETYQRARRVDATAMAAVTDGLNRLFSNDVAPLRAMREAGLGLVNAIAPLRRLLATAAAGGNLGATPRLLKGDAL